MYSEGCREGGGQMSGHLKPRRNAGLLMARERPRPALRYAICLFPPGRAGLGRPGRCSPRAGRVGGHSLGLAHLLGRPRTRRPGGGCGAPSQCRRLGPTVRIWTQLDYSSRLPVQQVPITVNSIHWKERFILQQPR